MNKRIKYLVATLVVVVIGSTLYFSQNTALFSGDVFKKPTKEECMQLRKDKKLVKGTRMFDMCAKVMKAASKEDNLTVQISANTPKSSIVVAGREDVSVAEFKFLASKNSVEVDDLTLLVGGEGTGDSDEIAKVKLVDSKTSNVVAENFVTNNKVEFKNLNFTVPADESANLLVSVDLNTISDGADTGDLFYFRLESISKATDLVTAGFVSAKFVGDADGKVNGNFMILRATYPTFSTVKLANNQLSNGAAKTIYSFNVVAQPEHDVLFGRLAFSLSGTIGGQTLDLSKNQVTNFQLYNAVSGQQENQGTVSVISGNYVVIDFPEEIVHPSGATYELRADINGIQENDYLNAVIKPEDVQEFVTGILLDFTNLTSSLNTNSIVWSDGSAPAQTVDSKNWTNGHLVPGLPTTYQTLTAK